MFFHGLAEPEWLGFKGFQPKASPRTSIAFEKRAYFHDCHLVFDHVPAFFRA
jgi:hypothetical protein